MAECAQDTEDCDVGCENSQAERGDDGEAEDDGHQERNHGRKSFQVTSWSWLLRIGEAGSVVRRWSFVVRKTETDELMTGDLLQSTLR